MAGRNAEHKPATPTTAAVSSVAVAGSLKIAARAGLPKAKEAAPPMLNTPATMAA